MKKYICPFLASISVAALLAATGCGTSPPARYYALQPVAVTADRAAVIEGLVISAGRIETPDYLDRPQIITRDGDQLMLGQFDRWAEPLGITVNRAFAGNLRRQLPGADVIRFPTPSYLQIDYRLVGRVTQFEAHEGDGVVLTLTWGIFDGDRQLVFSTGEATYRAPIQGSGDYAAIVAAMNSALATFSADVASQLIRIAQKRTESDTSD